MRYDQQVRSNPLPNIGRNIDLNLFDNPTFLIYFTAFLWGQMVHCLIFLYFSIFLHDYKICSRYFLMKLMATLFSIPQLWHMLLFLNPEYICFHSVRARVRVTRIELQDLSFLCHLDCFNYMYIVKISCEKKNNSRVNVQLSLSNSNESIILS